jgi:ADP-dependent NAD(P)H-hydrate dehydratase / NAD(P)H-hydrate epimerase
MEYINDQFVKNIKKIKKTSHKGDNGALTIIGGSHLFHGASLWALAVASRIIDMVYYSSVKENQELTKSLKEGLYSFIAIPQNKESDYISLSDAVLIGPGMVRGSEEYTGTGESGEETRQKTLHLLKNFPQKKWILDAGALQVVELDELLGLKNLAITPHEGEFNKLFKISLSGKKLEEKISIVKQKAEQTGFVIILKGEVDIVASRTKTVLNKTGNEGMTKGGTGDVLAGLIGALACTNDLFTASAAGVYVNGIAGDELYKKVGPYYNADQLADKVPQALWSLTK